MKKLLSIISLCLLTSSLLIGQDQVQALNYSQVYPVGSARFTSMGGAMGAVGGDFTAASVNPAGLGLYRSSELVFTPVFYWSNSTSNYLGNAVKDTKYNLNIGNLGLVSTYNTNRENGLVGATFAFGYNGMNNFHNSTVMSGINENSSLLDNFSHYANNNPNNLDPLYEQLAFDTYVMPYDSTAGNYWHYLQPFEDYDYEGYGQEQTRLVESRGYIGEYTFSGALNINHTLYFGATIGINALRYYEDVYHTETDVNNLEPEFHSFRFREFYRTRGVGYNFKLGVIFKPIHMLRIGASFHSPTLYNLDDEKFTDMNSTWDSSTGFPDESASSAKYAKEYQLQTPLKASVSAALLLGRLGLVSAEYEFVDYTKANLDSPGYKFFDENDAIRNEFNSTHNLKAGAEIRLNPLYLRGGLQYYMSPFENERNGSDVWVYSAGLGVRSNNTFLDVAYTLGTRSEAYGLYAHQPDQGLYEVSMNDYTMNKVMVTMGVKF